MRPVLLFESRVHLHACVHRNRRLHTCSLIRPRHDTDGASDDPRALGHADEPETCVSLHAVGGIESPAIIRDRDLGLVTDLEESYIRPAGAGVCDDVPQRFLRDSVDAERQRPA